MTNVDQIISLPTVPNRELNGDRLENRLSKLFKLDQFENQESDYLRAKRTISEAIKRLGKNLSNVEYLKSYAKKRIPPISWLPKYRVKTYLPFDFLIGLTVGIMSIPQGMAYALLATLPAVNGLYMSFFPVLVYAILGTSRHLNIGGASALSLLSGDLISRMVNSYEYRPLVVNGTTINDTAHEADPKEQYRLTVACSLTLLVGVIQALMGVCGLGIITSYFSDTFVSSYTSGSAVHGVVSQIKNLFGMKGTNRYEGIFKIPKTFIDLFSKLPNSNWKTILISLFGIVYLLVFKEILNPKIKKKIKVDFPSEFVLVVFMAIISYVAKFSSNLDIDTLKLIPSGLPIPQLPDPTLWSEMIVDGMLIAIIASSSNLSLVKLFSQKNRDPVDSTQDLYAYGGANILSSFFQCYPSGASLSRSSVLEAANARSQAASFFSSIIILVVILWLGPLFESLPKSCLACIIVVALKGLVFQIRDLFKLWKISKLEFFTWLITYLATVLLDVDVGLLIGLFISVFTVIVNDQFLKIRRQFKSSDSSTVYIDESSIQNDDILSPEITLDGSNLRIFKLFGKSPYDQVSEKETKKIQLIESAAPVSEDASIELSNEYQFEHSLILDLSAVNYIDTNGIKMLLKLIKDYQKVNVEVYLCSPQNHLIEKIYNMKLLENFDANIYLNVNDVLKHLKDQLKA